ncbi:hypothetical protein FRB95_014837 [Tulasnella sp. JGI-2019a]|nr:hypothetical protein FRB95_014837 [Tulasnella sp. JGI-2019a]
MSLADATTGMMITSLIAARATITEDLKDPQSYVRLVRLTQINRYFCLASTIIVWWDWFITLDDEIAYIWRPRKTTMTGKPLILAPGALLCEGYFYFIPFGTGSFLYAVDILLAYRALCLYRMNRRLLIFTSAFFIICFLTTVTLLIMAYEQQVGVIPTPVYLTSCWSTLGNLISMCAIPGLVFEVWLFAMVMYRVFTYSRQVGKWNRHGVIDMMVRDSVGWFAVVTSMLLITAVGYEVLPTGLRIATLPTLRGLIVICGCHLVLRMRKACCEEDDRDIRSAVSTVTRSRQLNTNVNAVPPSPTAPSTTAHGHGNGHCGASSTFHKLGFSRRAGEKSVISLEAILEATKLRRILDLAQKFGMPPPLRQDLESSIWDDPVMTLNVGMATELEREAGSRDIVTGRTMELGTIRPKSSNWADNQLDTLPTKPRRFMGASFFSQSPRQSESRRTSGLKGIDVDIANGSYDPEGDDCSVACISPSQWDKLDEHELREPRTILAPLRDLEDQNPPSFLGQMI